MLQLAFVGLVLMVILLFVATWSSRKAVQRMKRSQQQQAAFEQTLIEQVRQRINKPQSLQLLPQTAEQHVLCSTLDLLIEELPKQKHIDKLTGLINRAGLKQALHLHQPLHQGTLVLVDLYRFRQINDLFGFTFGDRVLQAFGKRVKNLPSSPTVVARMEGDEFLFYFESPLAKEALDDIQTFLLKSLLIDNTQINLTLQLGLLDLSLHHGSTSMVLKRLDLARIKAKSCKPNALGSLVAHYQKGEDQIQLREHSLVSHLPKALEAGQLSVLFQPKINLHNMQLAQAEALIRWQHPEYGEVSPAEFIPLVEGAGIIDIVSMWVFEEVLQQQAAWLAAGFELAVAINFSAKDISNTKFIDQVLAKLNAAPVANRLVVIEITESALMDDFESVIQGIEKLRVHGVNIAIDDFGTGHSSLAYLKHLPVDEIKIDKAFVDGLLDDAHAAEIMQTSIRLASNLGFKVTVEGVEEQPIADALISMGADMLQGDLYGIPQSGEQIQQFILSGQSGAQ
ncbi:putative bifunctional diguanylate cyclase/phosphodiesterase [Shewanella gelidii]|uniref:GGDEF-domain containing protein n=1 Tax=Shewanella gelidii TaxID=1642821 RepID=A0A917N752_9GAMM|nr:bifunctional diguanylate cyclase/phosphodiesterase [Shewanella gelidii]MCL1097178.1 bifunctional diguanylate cyclase/phosphodiesterase [Shewanella gelidii]GGI73082.1 GGDEF-domain containing protein [Shewanella gelidii]